MIGIEIHSEAFEQELNEVQLRVHSMSDTLMEVADIVEHYAKPLVPVDTTRLITSFKAIPLGESEGMIEVEVGYSAIDPRDYYDYARYTHEGIDYRTGEPIVWHRKGAERLYLKKGLDRSFKDSMTLVKGDYLSLFRGLGKIEYD